MRWPWRNKDPAIDPTHLDEVISANVALGRRLLDTDRSRYLDLTGSIVRDKRWEAAAGFEIDTDMIVTIAANAAVPIMGLDPWIYRQVRSVIVHPTATTHAGARRGPSGSVVSDTSMQVIGLASPYSGPVSLSWDAVLAGSREPGFGRNVVIHEFAHKIDMSDGDADGVPPLRGPALKAWEQLLTNEYDHTKTRESDSALRAYAWTNKAEFFAVATEAFFCTPEHLREAKPALYRGLCEFYNSNPAG